MRLANKISLGYAVVVLLSGLVVLVGFRQSLTIQEGIRETTDENLQIVEILNDMKISGLCIVSSINEKALIQSRLSGGGSSAKNITTREDDELYKKGVKLYQSSLRQYEEYVEQKHPRERPLLEKIRAWGEGMLEIGEEFSSVVENDPTEEEFLGAKELFEETEQGFLAAVDAAIAHEQGELLQKRKEMNAMFVRSVQIILLTGLFVFLAALAAGHGLSRHVSRPIEALRTAALRIGKGDLETRVEVQSRDEIGELASAFNQMVSDLNLFREALRESGEFARTVINSVPDAISIINPEDFTITGVNRVFLEETGLTEEEAIGQPCYLVTHGTTEPCSAFHEACPLEMVLKTGEHVTYEHSHESGDKAGRTVEVSASPIRDEEGKVVRIVHVSRDVTERKRSEQALLEKHLELKEMYRNVETSRREWEMTMDCLGEMIVLVDGEEKIRRHNKAFRDFTGLPENELDGADWNQFLMEEEIRVGTVFGEGGMEFFYKPAQQWYVLNSFPYEDPKVGVAGAVITIHNSTDLKYMADELEKTNRQVQWERAELQSALDQLTSLIQRVIREKDFSTRFTNPHLVRCYEVKNCTRKECPCYGKDSPRCWQVSGTCCGGQVEEGFATKMEKCKKCSVYQVATQNPVYQIGENFNNMMHILQMKNQELEQAYADLKSTQSRILQSEKMASIGQLAAGVAHEINNPMGFITSNLGTLEKYVLKFSEFIEAQSNLLQAVAPPEVLKEIGEKRKNLKLDYVLEDVSELIAESQEGAERVKKIVQNLKSFSRVDQADCKMADIHECLESTLNIVWNELKYKSTVKKEYGEIPRTLCHPQELNQVFMNLLVNAAQSIEKQGEITIRTEEDSGMIRVKISDTGSGIPPEKLQRIFDPFYTTKEVGKGTGLGLSICYDIVKKHKGDITVESVVGEGTTFTVSIPVVAGKEAEPAKEKEEVYG